MLLGIVRPVPKSMHLPEPDETPRVVPPYDVVGCEGPRGQKFQAQKCTVQNAKTIDYGLDGGSQAPKQRERILQ